MIQSVFARLLRQPDTFCAISTHSGCPTTIMHCLAYGPLFAAE